MGGAGGHMAHLHENTWLTFSEIKSFLTQVASGEMSPIEKVDGQNIHFRWTPNGIMCARNDGHIKKGGIPESEYRAGWAGHPAEDAFIKGFEKIKSAVENLSEAGKQAFMASQPGSYRFCNCEIMYPKNENLIMYDGNYVVLHNLKELAIIDNKVVQTEIFMVGDAEFDSVVSSLEDAEKSADAEEWQLFGPKFVKLKNIADGKIASEAIAAIDAIGYSDDQKIFQMVEDKLMSELGSAGISQEKLDALIKRIEMISQGAKTGDLPNLNQIKKGLTKEQKSLIGNYGSVTKAKKFIGLATVPVARAISDFAIEVLRGLESFFVTENDAEIARLRQELQNSIEKLQAYKGDDSAKYGEMLEKQLEKLGPIENIASTLEGIIFEYPPGSKSLVKFTGSFAMANQIIGRAKRMPDEQPSSETLDASDVFENFNYSLKELDMIYEAIGAQPFDSVAIIGGAFKPPHLGHLSMVDHYASLADKVIVYISDPKSAKSQRAIGGNPVTADTSRNLWELLVGGRSNVEIKVSTAPSPITIAYDSVMPPNPKTGHPGTPYEPGTTVYLGASVKGNDIQRFAGAVKKASPDINVPDPSANAAPAAVLPNQYMEKLSTSKYASMIPSVVKGKDPKDFSASDFRFLLEQAQTDPVAKDLAGYFVGHDKIDSFMSILGLSSIKESKVFSRYSLKRYLL